jgi:PIN domain nuclease of toxin-antitoxin system
VRHLLDPHSLLWYTLGDPQLGGTAKSLILDPANEILISPASYCKIAIKISLGKLTLHQPYEDFIEAGLNKYGFTILSADQRHTSICTPFRGFEIFTVAFG